ncbi:G-protein coupled receptor 157-like [Mytilus galloprovincialis]|uniref:G-protein coupled receptor 157-like n=1 Tax=Mytilus galloprovincialis TaxID=29158 RepID=UPI003F7C8761
MGNENSTVIYKNIYQDPYDTLPLVLTLISAPLSIVGALFIFITFSLVDEARNETRKLLVCLTISDFIMAISSTVGNVRYAVKYGKSEIIELACPSTECDYLCLIHGSVQTWANLCSFFWTTIIAFHLLTNVVFKTREHYFTLRLCVHGVAWGVPLVIVILAMVHGVIGEDYRVGSGLWCWISACITPSEQFFWMMVTGKGWELLMYLLTGASYILLKGYMIQKRKERKQTRLSFMDLSDNLRPSDENYLTLWLVIYVLRIWGTIRFGVAMYKHHTKDQLENYATFDKIFFYIQCFGDSSQAFFSCILFCLLDPVIRNSLLTYRRRQSYHRLDSVVA